MPLELTAKDFNNWTRRIWHETEKHHFQGKRRKGWDGRFLPEGSRALQRSHWSGPAVPHSADGECPTLAELCRALPYHSWVLGTDRLCMSRRFAQMGSSIATDKGAAMGLGRRHTPFWLASSPAKC